MKILHTADLHLDSPFSASDTLGADDRREAQRRCLTRIFDLAKRESCDIILIAGDLFDSKYVTPETEEHVKKLFNNAGVPVIVAPGNHDPYVDGSFYKGKDFGDNVFIFSSKELQRFDLTDIGVRVYGYAFTSPSLTVSPLAEAHLEEAKDPRVIDLLCAHADLSSPVSRYSPITLGDIAKLNVDYAALGHIHNSYDSGKNNIRYCGFAEGRSFDELGVGGVLIVNIDKDADENNVCSVSFYPVSESRYEIVKVELEGCDTFEDVGSRISDSISELGEIHNLNLRVCLYGALDPSVIPEVRLLEAALSRNDMRVEIKDLTVPVADVSQLRADSSLRGAFYNALYPDLIHDDVRIRERAALALRIGLEAIDGRRITGGREEK